MNEEKVYQPLNCPDILTVEECAAILKICPKQVRYLLQCEKIEHFRIGKSIRIPRVALEAYISRQMEHAG